MVARLDAFDAFADSLHHAGAFVSQDHGRRERRSARHPVPVAVADAGGSHFDERFAGLRLRHIHAFDAEGRMRGGQNGGLHLHDGNPLCWSPRQI